MGWTTTPDAGRFLAAAGPFLLADPVANNVLWTEAAFCAWLPDPVAEARFGWWTEGGLVGGAFVDLPDHPSVCSPLSHASMTDLPAVMEGATHLAVEARDVDGVTAAWRAHGSDLRPTTQIAVLRL